MKPPNFFLIGAPKCGTTALSQYLSEHPEVYFSDPKELHYFNTDFKNRYTRSWSRYLNYFAEADGYRAVGEGSVFYLASTVAVPNILAWQSDPLFVVMLRDPLGAAYACHAQAVLSHGEDVLDFQEAWELQGERRRGMRLPRGCEEPKVLLYGDLCRFGSQVERLLTWVSAQNVKFIVFDDFVQDTEVVYRDVLKFLGVREDFTPRFEAANRSRVMRSAFLWQAAKDAVRLKERLGVRKGFGIAKRVVDLNTVERPRRPLPKVFEEGLREYFREDVRRLEAAIGRDLSGWLTESA